MSSDSEIELEYYFFWRNYEGNVEEPEDGGDGNCIVHYEGDYSNYVMKVKYVNGKREGKAIIWNGEKPIIHLEYEDGVVNGLMEVMDESGELKLRGCLVKGEEKGVFKEYYKSMIVWMGYYRDGERYSVLRESVHMSGYYEEWSIANGGLLSIARYDAGMNEKNGYCIESDNGQLKEWMYENGVKKAIIKGSKANTLKRNKPEEERIDDGCKRVCLDLDTSLDEYDQEMSLIVQHVTMDYDYGVVKKNDAYYEVERSLYENRMICVDINTKEMRVIGNDRLLHHSIDEGVIDLDANGRRWEGGLKDGKPFGHGVVYNEEGKKEYEGYIMNGMRICYGIEFYDDVEKVKYVGSFFEDRRFGYGVLYNRNGDVEYKGIWKNDNHYSSVSNGVEIDNHMDSLTIPDNTYIDMRSFLFPSLIPSLKRIVIGIHCFYNTHSFVLKGMNELVSVVIGNGSFTEKDADKSGVHPDKEFYITDCPKLQSIKTDEFAFADFFPFELGFLPALESLEIGGNCFRDAPSFELTGKSRLIELYSRSSSASNYSIR